MITLTQEQFDTIINILNDAYVTHVKEEHCCGSCADGSTCESDLIRDEHETSEQYMERLKNNRIEPRYPVPSKEEQYLEMQRKIGYGKYPPHIC